MTIQQAINALLEIARLHGPHTEVYFDCPECNRAFAPDIADAKAEHRVIIPAKAKTGDPT